MKKVTRYISINPKAGTITIQRKKDFHEYRKITKSSNKRLKSILEHYTASPCKTSYGTILYYLYTI